MARASRTVWAKRVQRWERSGETARAFAARLRVNPYTLKWWRWVFARGQEGRERAAAPVGAAEFVELVHAGARRPPTPPDQALGVAAGAKGPSGQVEVCLPSGLHIIVPAAADVEAVGRLVAALERR